MSFYGFSASRTAALRIVLPGGTTHIPLEVGVWASSALREPLVGIGVAHFGITKLHEMDPASTVDELNASKPTTPSHKAMIDHSKSGSSFIPLLAIPRTGHPPYHYLPAGNVPPAWGP